MHYYLDVLKNYAGFAGRAARKEYWMFVLINMAVALAIYYFISQTIYFLYALAVLVPSLAVGSRRLHDTGRSAWWLLLAFVPIVGAIVLIVFFVLDSEPGTNTYGPNPKGIGDSAPAVPTPSGASH